MTWFLLPPFCLFSYPLCAVGKRKGTDKMSHRFEPWRTGPLQNKFGLLHLFCLMNNRAIYYTGNEPYVWPSPTLFLNARRAHENWIFLEVYRLWESVFFRHICSRTVIKQTHTLTADSKWSKLENFIFRPSVNKSKCGFGREPNERKRSKFFFNEAIAIRVDGQCIKWQWDSVCILM